MLQGIDVLIKSCNNQSLKLINYCMNVNVIDEQGLDLMIEAALKRVRKAIGGEVGAICKQLLRAEELAQELSADRALRIRMGIQQQLVSSVADGKVRLLANNLYVLYAPIELRVVVHRALIELCPEDRLAYVHLAKDLNRNSLGAEELAVRWRCREFEEDFHAESRRIQRERLMALSWDSDVKARAIEVYQEWFGAEPAGVDVDFAAEVETMPPNELNINGLAAFKIGQFELSVLFRRKLLEKQPDVLYFYWLLADTLECTGDPAHFQEELDLRIQWKTRLGKPGRNERGACKKNAARIDFLRGWLGRE